MWVGEWTSFFSSCVPFNYIMLMSILGHNEFFLLLIRLFNGA